MAEQKKSKKKSAPSLFEKKIGILLLSVLACIAFVIIMITLDILMNPYKSWTDSLAIRLITERRSVIPFFK